LAKAAAARHEDMHECSKVSPNGVPHVGGPIVSGCKTVWINGVLAATAGDACFCVGEPDTIITGSCSVFIEGKPAARKGDLCVHGGKITGGSHSVYIGGRRDKYQGPLASGEIQVYREPSEREKKKAIKQAIKDCTALLEKKLKLLKAENPKTLRDFKKWFGRDDEEARDTILERIRNALGVSRGLTEKNFDRIADEKDRRDDRAQVYNKDGTYRFFLGDPFWRLGTSGIRSRAGVLIHELSHFKKIGNTKDDAYYEKACLRLAKVDPNAALYNADSFELFLYGC
jgi:uncharacterized Zn-binding protein involved in type VI secretion